jgi:RNA polymerase sigma factor (sigma-70 family)
VRPAPAVGDLLRDLAPRVLGALIRRYGMFDLCEDAVQEALLAAATQWPVDGVPDHPRAWLLTVAARRLTDQMRSDAARRRREEDHAEVVLEAPAADEVTADRDDSLMLLFLCCHPSLPVPAQIALTLRSVGGLTTPQIARAFLVPDTTMGQRISRAKKTLAAAGADFRMPDPDEFEARLGAVLHVLYLIFNEGYATTSGPDLITTDLTAEAMRLTRQLHAQLPDHGEVIGLLALQLLTEARRPARVGPGGALIPLAEQDRGRWNAGAIAEGIELITDALNRCALGPYQVQAAIAAVHVEAPDTARTDWVQILGLYAVLEDLAPNPMVTLNRAVALAMVDGPRAGLRLLESLDGDDRIARHHRLPAVRAHLYELAGDVGAARESYLAAARRTTSAPEKRYLEGRAAALRS